MIQTITTKQLNIRPITQTDAKILFHIFKEQDIGTVSGTPGFKNLNEAGQYVAGLIGMNKTGLSYHWVFESHVESTSMGFCNFYLPAPHLIHLRNCETSFGTLHQYRQMGFTSEALRGCLDFIFNHEQFQRAEAYASPTNLGSQAILQRLGFQSEGVQRKKWLVNNLRHDMVSYALLAEDYVIP